MTLLPPDDPSDPLLPTRDPDVQRVDVVRAGGGPDAATPGDLGPALAAFGERSAAVLGSGTRTFFGTAKWMLLLAVVLAVAAGWWAGNGRALRGIVTALLVLGPAAVVAVVAAAQRAASALAAETWRQAGLPRQVLTGLLDQVAGAGDGPAIGDDAGSSAAAGVPRNRLPLSEAEHRLGRAADDWAGGGGSPGGLSALVGRGQRWVAGLVAGFARRGFRAHARSAGGVVDVPAVRDALAGRVDDWAAGQVRAKARAALGGAVIAVVAWAAVVAYAVRRVWT